MMPSKSSLQNRQKLRQQMRQQRRALSATERQILSLQWANHFCKNRQYRNSRHVAVYMAADGEVDLTPLMVHAWNMGKTIYLPVLNGPHAQSLFFAEYNEGDVLGLNRFRIPEPVVAARDRIKAQQLDMVLTPLVAFDAQGNRLGMGAGYYDRTFAFLKQRKYWIRPYLFGVAYAFQRVAQLEYQAWDVPLHAIVTEDELIQCELP